MKLPRETVLTLMALADGELEGDAKERAEKMLAESSDARRVVDAMRAPHIAAWLGASTDARARGADGIVDAVMQRLADLPLPSASVMATRRARRVSRTAFALVGSALAVAAVVTVYVRAVDRRVNEPVLVASASPAGSPQLSPGTSALARIEAQENAGVEVNEIDSPSRGVSVFEIPVSAAGAAVANASGSPRVVIWIEDEPGAK